MIKKIARKLDFLLLQTRIRSLSKAKSTFPDAIDLKKIQQAEDYLRPFYTHYVKEISRADMAASFQLAALLRFFCSRTPKKKIVDFGSGFTSFVLRDYAKADHSIKVWSVDDDAQWIEKTRAYLKYHQLNDNNLIMLTEFISSGEADFDLALLDLNFVEVRKNYIKLVLERCRPG